MNVFPKRRPPAEINVFDVSTVERDIAEVIASHPQLPATGDAFAPKTILPLPSYVEHLPGVDEIGRLTAEAVVKEYETTAKEIEATMAELLAAQRRCEEETAKLQQVIEEMKAVAEHYRAEGKRAFEQIERLSKMTADARQACVDLRDRITTV